MTNSATLTKILFGISNGYEYIKKKSFYAGKRYETNRTKKTIKNLVYEKLIENKSF